jgi:hypothetical protein
MKIMDSNPFSARFLAEVERLRPAWSKEVAGDPDSPGAVIVLVSEGSPNGPLKIFTENDEITVAFAGMHEHFGSWTGATEQEAAIAALWFVDRILADEEVIVVGLEDGQVCRVWTASPGRELEDTEPRLGEMISVRSWSGRFDQTLGAS